MNVRPVIAEPPAESPDKLSGRADRLVRWLIQHAARNAPPTLAERLEEEWLADLTARKEIMSRLRFGVGCCWATRVINYEHSTSKVLAAGSKTGSKTMTAYAQHDYSFFSRRSTAFLLIVGLHVVVIYGLATGLARSLVQVVPTRMVAAMLQDPPARDAPPPELPPPHFMTRQPEIVERKLDFNGPPDTTGLQSMTTDAQIFAPPVAPPARNPVTRVLGGPGKGFPNTEDYYPPGAIRMGKTGVATVQVCVDDRGRLTAAPTLAQTSGTASLDEGALRLAKAGSGHYRATTDDGQPVNSCYQIRVRYDLKDLLQR
jgi:periplasmic protein TonB